MQFRLTAFTALAVVLAATSANPLPNPGEGGAVARGASGGSTSEQWGKNYPDWPGQGYGPWKGKGPKPDNWGEKKPCCKDRSSDALVVIDIAPGAQCPSNSDLVYISVLDLLSINIARGESEVDNSGQWGYKGAGSGGKPGYWGDSGAGWQDKGKGWNGNGPKPSNWGDKKPCCKDTRSGAIIEIDIGADEECPSGTELVYITIGNLLSIGIL